MLVNCPVCGRQVKVLKSGKLARHGYGVQDGRGRSRQSLMSGRCYGVGAKPEEALQKAADILNYYIEGAVENGDSEEGYYLDLVKQRDGFLARMG